MYRTLDGRCLSSALHSPVDGGRSEQTGKGNRPSFSHAARPEQAEPLYDVFSGALEDEGFEVARDVFGARMSVELANDGPVTILLET
jgi:D-tyrosyl-tRNA(Tyr) deacylase